MKPSSRRDVFVTGATGYLGSALARELVERGHRVRALVRAGSEKKLVAGCEPVPGDALDAATYQAAVAPADTFVQLVGIPKPAPWKGDQFRAVDQRSALAGIVAAKAGQVRHFVYVSVAQPAPVMRSYVLVRAECEAAIGVAGLVATILRPWYVIGPGHYWPLVLRPAYSILEAIPRTRESAVRLGFVTLAQMVTAMVASIENPPKRTRILATAEIRAARA
ncbi:MAG TPA: NAD(P)H-binding protein [Planctomycetota bacterium]|jgi:uncharacterized protein YbjT (DUF2867 family)|nr:NAD(P)H-binding protein [Planctomycetota bacterium]